MSARNAVAEFLNEATSRLSLLERHGFERAYELEYSTSTGALVVYRGRNVAFRIAFDLRDQYVTSEVVKVCNRELLNGSEGGYASDVVLHLMRHEGVSDVSLRAKHKGVVSGLPVGQQLDAIVDLLQTSGHVLVEDRPDSLPECFDAQYEANGH